MWILLFHPKHIFLPGQIWKMQCIQVDFLSSGAGRRISPEMANFRAIRMRACCSRLQSWWGDDDDDDVVHDDGDDDCDDDDDDDVHDDGECCNDNVIVIVMSMKNDDDCDVNCERYIEHTGGGEPLISRHIDTLTHTFSSAKTQTQAAIQNQIGNMQNIWWFKRSASNSQKLL